MYFINVIKYYLNVVYQILALLFLYADIPYPALSLPPPYDPPSYEEAAKCKHLQANPVHVGEVCTSNTHTTTTLVGPSLIEELYSQSHPIRLK